MALATYSYSITYGHVCTHEYAEEKKIQYCTVQEMAFSTYGPVLLYALYATGHSHVCVFYGMVRLCNSTIWQRNMSISILIIVVLEIELY